MCAPANDPCSIIRCGLNVQATLDADKAAKAVAAEKKRDMKKWAGKKEELFKLIRTRLVAQVPVMSKLVMSWCALPFCFAAIPLGGMKWY